MASSSPERRPPHAVCMPYPAQGHVTPMLKLAKLLHARAGFHITFVNTEYNHRRLVRSQGAAALESTPAFRFAAIPDGLPSSDADATQDIPALCYSTMTTCLPHLLNLLEDLNTTSEDQHGPVTCLLFDAVMSFGYDAARAAGVPAVALWTASCCGFMGYRNYRHLVDCGLVPFRDASELVDVPGSPLAAEVRGVRGMCTGVQLRDFPSLIRTTDRGDVMLNFLMRESERLSLPDAAVVNSFEALEGATLDAMRAILPPMYALGPLLLLERRLVPETSPLRRLGSSLWKEQADGLAEWLAGRASRSVVYVNYGSITVMTPAQLLEFAWGLAGSGYPFVWNVRPDLLKGYSAAGGLPPEFLAAVEGRALLTTWCPQETVLAHEAVGVFLTHSGWNSTLESVCAGVPMLCWPFFAEQQTNCRYKRTEWGIGMEIGGEVRRDEVAAVIREAMDGEKGKEMRRRAEEWKDKALEAAAPGGQAEANLDRLINEVLLAKRNKQTSLLN